LKPLLNVRRFKEDNVTTTRRIPLFPLGVVLLPGMVLPLHIFEERYKQMIGACLDGDRPFGIVLFDGQTIRSVGCLARITEVVKRYDDGRMDIVTRGGTRFVVRELIEEKSYLEARVHFFDDAEEGTHDQLQEEVARAWRLLKAVAEIEVGFAPAELGDRISPQQLSFAIASLEGFEPIERQGILEMTSTPERLRKCVQALAKIVARSRLSREIQQLIGGNGKPPRNILQATDNP
jgi:Lon protease-like protein